ncbi:DUF2058 domain-containing protein [Gilvimarinus polysaccharolyticus]|uniref:DUF2058 domain-containing protein n=1 Tax=Gilvimarinus polysaccharolyticus TaxID=863921 RepID=UPI0006735D37|nr:DUF2058 domain-containing protein [Gilvimarinus polysaccharolyticus]
MASLQDQLKQAGLINEKAAKQIQKDKRKQTKQAHKSKQVVVDETKQSVQAARAEKAERDRELNRQRQAEAEQKAIAAQIKQLIETHRQPKLARGEAELEYNFTDGKTIKKLLVSAKVQQQLMRGQLAIAKLGEGHELVPRIVADKIALRDSDSIILAKTQATDEPDEDDPYKDYVIPDDLMW